MIVINIPVKVHVKKYLVKRYGSKHTITKKSFIGLFILELLERKVEPHMKNTSKECSYDIEVSEFYFNKRGFYVDHVKLKFLGICLEKLFLEDFFNFIDLEMRKENANARKSIKFFLSINDIQEDELKLESIYRSYQRYSNENIKNKKIVKI
ncbi:hypothetical protein LXD69_10115 [Flavobacterium sediminilitoris]|uniref:Uncharacterized protein n=1 Tax=Flavobacterium sediminilitoris TaxID=2024526 RepID=A0ABY4HIC5_9FLAO|nr:MULTISPECIES: hypothetical protein [Flavobacterium]UOX32406.1 hypothetical protein LXD69_10115 [Flavobacterium sediminilitoris]